SYELCIHFLPSLQHWDGHTTLDPDVPRHIYSGWRGGQPSAWPAVRPCWHLDRSRRGWPECSLFAISFSGRLLDSARWNDPVGNRVRHAGHAAKSRHRRSASRAETQLGIRRLLSWLRRRLAGGQHHGGSTLCTFAHSAHRILSYEPALATTGLHLCRERRAMTP